MSFKDWLAGAGERRDNAAARLDALRRADNAKGTFAGVTLADGFISWTDGRAKRREPVPGARAEVSIGADAQRRITATRIVLVGAFALAWRKQQGSGFLTIENDGYYIGLPFPIKEERAARAFSAKINDAARSQ